MSFQMQDDIFHFVFCLFAEGFCFSLYRVKSLKPISSRLISIRNSPLAGLVGKVLEKTD